jgi:gamma-butyrobetaine dioxygenase
VPLDIQPILGGVKVLDNGIEISWADGHRSTFTASFLERHSSRSKLSAFHRDVSQEPWDKSRILQTKDLFLQYDSLQTPAGLLSAISQLSKYGLVFFSGVPTAETSNETCELRTLAQRFGEIRETFYGQTWDVKNVRNSKNIAYTNLDLGLHMDLLYVFHWLNPLHPITLFRRYFQHPPRYQILHCLRNSVIGGTSVFADALHAATALRASHPDEFAALNETPVAFHYINDGHHLHYEHPTIELAPGAAAAEERPIAHVNYSPPFQAPLPLNTPPAFYPALARFASFLGDPARTYTYTLREGDAVMFDNRRVLHARTAFQDKNGGFDGTTNRWLKGCYLEADAVMDKWRVLKTKADQKLA